MAATFFSVGRPLVVGANHRSSSMMLRDRLFVEDDKVPAFLDSLRRSGISQAMVISTCDRVEVQAIHADNAYAVKSIRSIMADYVGLDPADMDGQIYELSDEQAVRHIFTVPSSLDSLMIGEPQVLGQVKAARRMARDAGMVGAELEAVLQAAFEAAKRVRSETAIGQKPVSMATVAVQLAKNLHGYLEKCSGLLVGAGDMGELVASSFISAGIGHFTVTHPNEARAETLAQSLDCHVATFETLSSALAEADIVLASMGTRRHILTADMVTSSLRKRRHKPVLLIDAAIPCDVEPAVNRIDEAFLYDLNDLEQVAMEGRANRESEAVAGWKIIDEEVAGFLRRRSERVAVPTLSLLRAHFEAERERALADADNDAEKATRLLVNRLLHGPSKVMRLTAGAAGHENDKNDWYDVERTLRRLFLLEDIEDDSAARPSKDVPLGQPEDE